MNTQKVLLSTLTLLVALATPMPLFSQEDEASAQAYRDASIKRLQQRVSEIESEMKDAERSHAQALGEEVFNLYGQIDQTYLKMNNTYQQQVIELNSRMQRKWEQVESAGVDDRDLINQALEQLEKDWDRTFDRLTTAHQNHLKQLGESLAKLQGEFSQAAGRAQAELEASNFEAVARWEEAHDLFLAINRTYVEIVNDQLHWQQKQLAKNPSDKKLMKRLDKTRSRHADIQKRFQGRLSSHVEHLEKEIETRIAQLKATSVWETRREIMTMVDNLYTRNHTTFEMLQTSYRDMVQACASRTKSMPSTEMRVEDLAATIKGTKSVLTKSYLARVEFIDRQIADFDARIEKGASDEEEAIWKAKMTDLRLLAKTLETKAIELAETPVRTVRR